MKRNLFVIVCLFLLIVTSSKNKVKASNDTIYVTSEGIKFRVDDVLVYDDDLVDKKFDTKVEFVDYIYNIGYKIPLFVMTNMRF